MESARTRDWTHVPCTGRWILNHWTTREAPHCRHSYFKMPSGDFPSGPVVKIPRFHCRGHTGLTPDQGSSTHYTVKPKDFLKDAFRFSCPQIPVGDEKLGPRDAGRARPPTWKKRENFQEECHVEDSNSSQKGNDLLGSIILFVTKWKWLIHPQTKTVYTQSLLRAF